MVASGTIKVARFYDLAWPDLRSDHPMSLSAADPHFISASRSVATRIVDEKLKELHVEELRVQANDRGIAHLEIDPEREKKLLTKLDLRVVPSCPCWHP